MYKAGIAVVDLAPAVVAGCAEDNQVVGAVAIETLPDLYFDFCGKFVVGRSAASGNDNLDRSF